MTNRVPMTKEEIEYYLAEIETNLTLERTGYDLAPLAHIL